MSSQLSPSWAQVIRDAIDAALAELHTGLPAKVVSFDPAIPSCSVQPLLVRIILDENQVEQPERIPQIVNVPIVYPGGGDWEMTWPLKVDDIVWLAFAERSLDTWLDAPAGTEVDPGAARKHDLSDAIAIPRLRPRSDPRPVSATDLRIGRVGGQPAIVLKPDGSIEIGEGATEPMVLGTALQSFITAFVADIVSTLVVTVGGVASTPGAPNTVFTAAASLPLFSNCLSPKGKVL